MIAALLFAVVWPLLSVAVAVGICRVIRTADRAETPAEQPKPEQVYVPREVGRVIPDPNWTEPVSDPQTFGDARANLEHTLQIFGGPVPDDGDRMVLMATCNVYGPNVKTGLTLRDLRLIAKEIGAGQW